ncbi:hypothetical protein GYMLUDRAFT_45677 [Collybiopsis luxurians FD-317 M1]|uniref:Unplaced genomic scaffold GYMLUscaffold_39, whole genome shotgun sequence n=1 Tax=Collybiopsis luxurians FD-317 M1 TaxID=944289 RepID=A0A0D0CIJ9_9AGAR|nr:hypothetical protein GYMLUDRAFT_45677 [Collybiopsis luxurians FD-317 M1]
MEASSPGTTSATTGTNTQQKHRHPRRYHKNPDEPPNLRDNPQSSTGQAQTDAQNSSPSERSVNRRNRRNRPKPQTAGQSSANDKPREKVANGPSSSRPGRAKFNSSLTSDTPAQSSRRPRQYGRGKHNLIEPDAGDLTSNLIRQLSFKPFLDCLICFAPIHPKQPTWSCSPLIPIQDDSSEHQPQYCWTTFHLKCIHEWAEKSYKEVKAAWEAREEFDKDGEWRCPGCQGRRNKLMRGYVCFCGSTHSPNNNLATPHSCGNACSRPRASCSHPCPLLCHPGPCPPCKVITEIPCGCIRQQPVAVRCGENTQVSCRQTCSKMLDCGKHTCQQTCHLGPCTPCDRTDTLDCWCGKEQKQVPCGEGDIWLDTVGCDDLSTEAMLEPRKGFGCLSPCGKSFDCGNHSCSKPCHPPALDSRPGHCPKSPDRIVTCPCGKQSIASSSSTPQPGEFPARAKCTDPIPTCASTCLKSHSDCEHLCQSKCHTSLECPPCSVSIVRPCRCGSTTRTLRCGDLRTNTIDPETGMVVLREQEILCSRPCPAMRSCGSHQCNRICCPLASLAGASLRSKGKKRAVTTTATQFDADPEGLHVCDLVCGKMLSCGEHQCEERDHRGPCKPCLRSSFEDLICFCGKTVLEPPIPCGTKVHCGYECSLPPPPCGHPKTPHTCHFPEVDCPPCVFLTTKPCACGKRTLPNLKCSLDSSKISCGQVCGKLMPCGWHKCDRSCHAGDCGACTSMCGKARKGCLPDHHHPCTNLCHAPTACDEDEPCQSRVEVSCECGRVKQAVVCGRCRGNPEGNPAAGKPLKCTAECAVKKRNERLADALGISKSQLQHTEVTYADELVAFGRTNGKFLGLVEDALNEFVKSSRGKQVLPHMPPEKRSFVIKLAAIYRMDTQLVDVDPHRSVQIIRRIDTRVPTPLLSAHIATKLNPGGLGKLGILRNGVHAAPSMTTTTTTPPSGSGSGSGSVTPTRGWTSVVAPTPTASRAAAVAAVMLSSTLGVGTSPSGSRTATPAPAPSPAPAPAPPKSKPATPVNGQSTEGEVKKEESQSERNDVPDNWEDDD